MMEKGRIWTLRRIILAIIAVVAAAVLILLVAQIFTGCLVDVGNEMDPQESVGYMESPRGAAPEEAVPFSGPDLIPSLGSPTNPVSATEESIALGEEGYDIFCRLCHGDPGGESGAVGVMLSPRPPDVMDRMSAFDDGGMFTVIVSGFGRMPALASRMEPETGWDIVNYLRSVGGEADQPPEPAESHMRAVRVYSVQCAKCHGPVGEGALGPPLYPSSYLAQASDEEIRNLLEAGRVSRGMPAFGARLAPGELEGQVRLLQQLQTEGPSLLERSTEELRQTTTTTAPAATTTTAPPASTTSPRGDPEVGSRVFSASCRGCHGEEGAGGSAAQLQPNSFVQQSSDDELESLIAGGRPGTSMPAFEDRLKAEEMAGVIALLRNWQDASPSETTETDSGTTETGSGTTEAVPGTTEKLPFSHRAHAAKDVDCLFCHSSAQRGPAADVPPLELCAGCHRGLEDQGEVSTTLSRVLEEGRTVSWPRIYRVPDWVFFSHQAHVQVAEIECSECHGDVASMEQARSAQRMTMGFCLDCHERQDETYLIDCQVCHK